MSHREVAIAQPALWRLVPVDAVSIVKTDPGVWISSGVDSTIDLAKIVGVGYGVGCCYSIGGWSDFALRGSAFWAKNSLDEPDAKYRINNVDAVYIDPPDSTVSIFCGSACVLSTADAPDAAAGATAAPCTTATVPRGLAVTSYQSVLYDTKPVAWVAGLCAHVSLS